MPKRLRYQLERDPASLNAALDFFLYAIERALRQAGIKGAYLDEIGSSVLVLPGNRTIAGVY